MELPVADRERRPHAVRVAVVAPFVEHVDPRLEPEVEGEGRHAFDVPRLVIEVRVEGELEIGGVLDPEAARPAGGIPVGHGDRVAFSLDVALRARGLRADRGRLEVVRERHGGRRRGGRGPLQRGVRPLRRLRDPRRVAVDAGFRIVERLEADLFRGRAGLEAEVEGLRVPEERVGDERPGVLPLLLPVREALAREVDGLPRAVPVEVVFHRELVVTPVPAQQRRLRGVLPVDDVALEGERQVRLDAGALDLPLEAEGEDVVADHVLPAVVLVEASGLHVVDEVVLHRDPAAPLVGVEPPASVAVGVDVVDAVVRDGRPLGRPEGVDAAHVAHHAPSEVVDVVEVDRVPLADARGVAPAPADGDPGVEEVGDLVVRDRVVGAVADPDGAAAGEDPAAVAEDAVVDDDVVGEVGGLRVVVRPALADLDAAGAEVVKEAPHDAAVAAGAAEPDAVRPDVADLAVLEGNALRAVGRDDARDGDRRLGVGVARGREAVRGVAEGEPLEGDVLDELPRRGVALDFDERRQDRRDDAGLRQVLARERVDRERPVAVEEPLAGRVEGGLDVLDVVSLARLPLPEGPRRGAPGDERPRLRVDRGDAVDREGPRVVGGDDRVGELLLRERVERLEVLPAPAEGAAAEVRVLAGRGVDPAVDPAEHVVIELVRRAGAGRAPAVDVELFEVKRALLHLGDLGGPDAAGAGLEAGDDAAAGEDGPRAGGGLVGDGGRFGPAVLRLEDERLRHRVVTGGDENPDGPGEGAGGLEGADGVAGAGQRRLGAVRLPRVRALERPGPRVVAVGGDVPGGGGSGVDGGEEDAETGQETHGGSPRVTRLLSMLPNVPRSHIPYSSVLN